MTPESKSLRNSEATFLQEEQPEVREGYMFVNQFHPNAEFVVISEALPWEPENVGQGQLLSDFTTRMIQYTGARNEFAFLFPYEDANVTQGQRYTLGGDWSDIGQQAEEFRGEVDPEFIDNFVNVTFQPIAQF